MRTYGVDQESHHLFCEGNKKHYKFKIKNNRIPFIKHIYNLFLNSHKKKPFVNNYKLAVCIKGQKYTQRQRVKLTKNHT